MTKIYFFSGTGNSLWSAKKIAQIINSNSSNECELYNIAVEAQKYVSNEPYVSGESCEIFIEADAVVFVFPSYAYSMPLVVRRFIERAVFKTSYIASFVTYGSSPGGTLGSLRRILKKKGIPKMFFAKIPAVENYLAMFGPPKDKTIKQRTKMQEEATEKAALSIIERKENSVSLFYPFSFLVSLLFLLALKLFYKYYRVGYHCNGCATCEKVCPVSAIVMKDGRPQFTSKCEHCQACINICSLRAIQFGRVKFGTRGYCHPEIEIAELERKK
ncbi:MAG: EFR1 family ferrodoxin [Treponema sp.]|nr:EFR1 family ferrodoxin [Treponema sp.]MCL2252514.1 EFR1 family ferrodoxin [Treponema sp.]